jgi:CO/xanthine dehydrogenase Mo-binding subunit
VRPVVGDSALAPDSGSTSASRGTYVVWQGARLAAPGFAADLCAAAAALLDRPAGELALAPGGIVARGANSGAPLLTYAAIARQLPAPIVARAEFEFPKADVSSPDFVGGNARFLFAFGAVVARVRICRDSGMVRVLALYQHTAAGPVVDLAGYLGQIEGGMVQALGYTLSETLPMQDGRELAGNFDGYMMPVAADAPAMAVLALERLDAGDNFGPRGIGELGIGAAGAAIANAVADALGAWPDQLPIRPDWVLDQLERSER